MRIERDRSICEGFARDASGLWLVPEGLARPTSRDEVVDVLRDTASTKTAVTPAGAQTSTTGASLAAHGVLLSLRPMARVLDVDAAARRVRVEPGVLLSDLDRVVASDGLFFPPDPTSDETCTVGGAIACNASGPRTLRYGATRAWVEAVTVALADGSVRAFRRSRVEKNTVGYGPTQDLVDWFVGSEGTLGVIVEAELRLLPRPVREMGLGIPFATPADAIAFVRAARGTAHLAPAVQPRCLEYFDAESLRIARGDSAWGQDGDVLIYAEDTDEPAGAPAHVAAGGGTDMDAWLALAERHHARVDDIRVFEGNAAIREARHLRHAVPAGMHERTAPYLKQGGRRISTDWAVPLEQLEEALNASFAYSREAGVEMPVTYGHIGNGHPHQNWVARNPDEVRQLEAVVERCLRTVISLGGTVAAEHGIGKVKSKWLGLQANTEQRALMRAAKAVFDPEARMAPGNVLG